MTSDTLRDLLHERVADEAAADLAAGAWRTGRRRRHRRAAALVGGVVGVTVATSGAVAWVGSTPPAGERLDRPAPDAATTDPADPDDGTPDGTLGAVPSWLGPTLAEEPGLPPMEEDRPPLPRVLDVRDPATTGAVATAVAAVPVGRGADRAVVLVADDGTRTVLPTTRLDRVGDAAGNLHDPEMPEMLAPDGRHLLFPQTDHALLYDVAAAAWSRVDLPDAATPFEFLAWLDDATAVVFGDTDAVEVDVATGRVWPVASPLGPPPAALGRRSQAYTWPVRARDGATAQSWWVGRTLRDADGVSHGEPEALVVDDARGTALLAVPDSVTAAPSALGGRWKACCPAATWVAPGVAAYVSRNERTLLLAWRVRTDRVELVTEVLGAAGTPSFADFS